jgi:hypothetical protein
MIVLATILGLAAISPAFASKPMPKTIVGCVVNGAFIADGYSIRPRYADGREADLRSFEGRIVTIKGALLPGDLMIISKPPRDSGRCETK